MDLAEMKLAAQNAFVQKRIDPDYIRQWGPDRVLKIMALVEAARGVMEEVDSVEGIYTDAQKLLSEAFEYIDAEKG